MNITEEERAFFDKLYHDNYFKLVKVVWVAIPKADVMTIEEITQTTMLKALENVGMLMEHPNPFGWLLGVEMKKIHEYNEKVKNKKKRHR